MTDFAIFLFAALPMVLGLTIIVMGMRGHQKRREMQHRERMAMIERGLMPPPEASPEVQIATRAYVGAVLGGRDRAIPLDSRGHVVLFLPKREKYRTAGITIIGFGLALLMIIRYAANEPEVALGVGGAFVVLGGAFVVNSLLGTVTAGPQAQPPAQPAPQPTPAAPPPAHDDQL